MFYERTFRLPDDIWLVDLDSNKLICPGEIPPLPEPEGTILKNHLRQVCNSALVLLILKSSYPLLANVSLYLSQLLLYFSLTYSYSL